MNVKITHDNYGPLGTKVVIEEEGKPDRDLPHCHRVDIKFAVGRMPEASCWVHLPQVVVKVDADLMTMYDGKAYILRETNEPAHSEALKNYDQLQKELEGSFTQAPIADTPA